jgi:membrane protein DedA with SNARE-associated domain
MIGQSLPYLAILATLLASGLGAPFPEEVVVVTAAILSKHDQMNPLGAFAVCWVGALASDCMLYAMGYRFGKNFLREHRFWTYVVTPQREQRMEDLIRRHGMKVLFSARFLVGVRAAIFLAAGIVRVPLRRFVLADAISVSMVTLLFFSLSYYYGESLVRWILHLEQLATIAIVLAALGVGLFFWRQRRRSRMD